MKNSKIVNDGPNKKLANTTENVKKSLETPLTHNKPFRRRGKKLELPSFSLVRN
jgi:hypothetical protein